MTIGTVDDLTLEKARQEASRLRRGDMPTQGRSARFSVVAASLRETRRYKEWRPSTRSMFDYCVRRIVTDRGDPPVHRFSREVCQELIEQASRGMSTKLAECLKTVFSHAVETGILPHNPALGLRTPPRRQRDRILSDEELKTLLNDLYARQRRTPVASELLLVLLTCCRPGEAAEATVDEFKPEADRLWWTVPKERAKSGIAIRRPLSRQAEKIVKPHLNQPTGTRLFRDSTNKDRQNLWFRRATSRLGLAHCTPHDLRRTSRSILSRLHVRAEVAELLLGHSLQGVLAIYDRYSYDPEKVTAVELLSDEFNKILGHPAEDLFL